MLCIEQKMLEIELYKPPAMLYNITGTHGGGQKRCCFVCSTLLALVLWTTHAIPSLQVLGKLSPHLWSPMHLAFLDSLLHPVEGEVSV